MRKMSEYSISISNLNDFVFCPASIYFHALDGGAEKLTYQSSAQLNGTAAHRTVDESAYTTSAHVLQGICVYTEKYDLFGKIDSFDVKSGVLRERKKKIRVVYDGYVFQLYAQCFALREMGYTVRGLALYSMEDNRTYPISLPEHDQPMLHRFCSLIDDMKAFSLDGFVQQNIEKCRCCIYEPLCSFSKCKEAL